MMLAYQLPEYMKNAVPFAFDGAGTFYLFDIRHPPVGDEFPIALSHAGSLGCDEDHERLADSFVGALSTAARQHEQRRTTDNVRFRWCNKV